MNERDECLTVVASKSHRIPCPQPGQIFFFLAEGRRETWIRDPLPGGWVCAEPDEIGPGGRCGMPVESEPCSIHHPWQGEE